MLSDEATAQLWRNGRDSLQHALDHFDNRSRERENRWHHDKWIVLSVHHAAECICHLRLRQLDPSSDVFANTSRQYPSLSRLIDRLMGEQNIAKLTSSERSLFTLLLALKQHRDGFTHRSMSEEFDVSLAAKVMVALLKYMERVVQETSSDLVWQSTPVERDVVEAIHWRELDAYTRFIEAFVREQHPNQYLARCPSCGGQTVVNGKCEACYEELGEEKCPETDEPLFYMAWERRQGDVTVECDHCEGRHIFKRR